MEISQITPATAQLIPDLFDLVTTEFDDSESYAHNRLRGASVTFAQARTEDAPAVALYSKVGRHEEVLHFAIPVGKATPERTNS